MSRSFFRLLLILSLLFNAVAAPWAQAHMRHGDGASHHAQMPAGEHAHHAMSPAEDPAPMNDDSCCEGGACQCGCVLAPALPPIASAALPRAWNAAPAAAPQPLALIARDNPPFRPPAA